MTELRLPLLLLDLLHSLLQLPRLTRGSALTILELTMKNRSPYEDHRGLEFMKAVEKLATGRV